MTENQLSKIVFQSALYIHRELGPGLLEKIYELCLYKELISQNLKVERQKSFPVVFKDQVFDEAYRVDLIIEDKLVIEVKTVAELNDIHVAQVMTYLKLSGCTLGMLINFNTVLIKNGVRRVVLNL
jgi:GxxExxY protein